MAGVVSGDAAFKTPSDEEILAEIARRVRSVTRQRVGEPNYSTLLKIDEAILNLDPKARIRCIIIPQLYFVQK